MPEMQLKKDAEVIFKFQPKYIRLLTIRIGIVLCCLSYGAVFSYKPFSAYAAEPHPIARSRSKKDLSFNEERNKIIKKYLKMAQKHYEEGKYYEAIKLWNDVLAFDPNDKKAKEGIELAGEKIAKVKDFFGKDVFREFREISILSLQDCIEIVKETSLQFQIAKEQINLAKIKLWQRRRTFLPDLTLSWTETKGIRSEGKIEGIEYGIEGKQPAFRSGELMYGLAQSKTNLRIAENNYGKIGLKLWFEVAEAYYSFVKSKKLLRYTKALYEDIKPFYEMARKEHEKKVVPDIEYLDVESKFNHIYYKSIVVESDFEITKLALEQKLNIERAGTIDVLVDILLKSIDKDVNSCLFLAIENRPDLKMSELVVRSMEYGKKIAQAKGLPRVDLTAYYKKADEVYHRDFNWTTRDEASLDPQRKWYAGVEVAWPFLGSTGTYALYKREDPATLSTYFGAAESKGTSWKLGIADNLKQFSESKEAEISLISAKDELKEMRKKVIREVKDAFYGYKKAHIQLEAAKVQKEFNEKETEIFKVKHSLGEAKLSELFSSLTRLMDANEAYFNAEKDLHISIAALNQAIGVENYF